MRLSVLFPRFLFIKQVICPNASPYTGSDRQVPGLFPTTQHFFRGIGRFPSRLSRQTRSMFSFADFASLFLPSSVVGPVERPPCIRHRLAGASHAQGQYTLALQGVPLRVFAPQKGRCFRSIRSDLSLFSRDLIPSDRSLLETCGWRSSRKVIFIFHPFCKNPMDPISYGEPISRTRARAFYRADHFLNESSAHAQIRFPL